MAKLRVVKSYSGLGWNVGDEIEAFGGRIKELVDQGIAVVLVPDEPVEEVKVEEPKVEEPKVEIKQGKKVK